MLRLSEFNNQIEEIQKTNYIVVGKKSGPPK
jgi:hypothetical protein